MVQSRFAVWKRAFSKSILFCSEEIGILSFSSTLLSNLFSLLLFFFDNENLFLSVRNLEAVFNCAFKELTFSKCCSSRLCLGFIVLLSRDCLLWK